MNKPERIFKYQTFDQYSLRNLKNAQVYFNRPADFNDPFDCAVGKESVAHSKDDLFELINSYVREGNLPGCTEFNCAEEMPDDLIQVMENNIRSVAESLQHHNLYNTGCCCFSENNDHILMWSHYADGHRGFCLEFDTDIAQFKEKLFKVTYSDTYPEWNIASMTVNAESGFSEDDIRYLTHKYKTWKYEEEWRLFHKEPQKLFGYDVEAIKSVYFGLAALDADIEIACLILLGQNPSVKFYRAVRNEKPYRLKFEEFTYTPFKHTT